MSIKEDKLLSTKERRKQIKYHKRRYEQLKEVESDIEYYKTPPFKYRVNQLVSFKDKQGICREGKINTAQTTRRYRNYYNIVTYLYRYYYDIVESKITPIIVGAYKPGEDEQ